MQSISENGWRTRSLAVLLAVLTALPPAAYAQAPVQPNTTQSLKVIPLAGNGEMNDLSRKVMAPLVVQVLDQESRPVSGASVVFRFPLDGPSATFPNQQTSLTVRTNPDGQAAATGWAANNLTGPFQVNVTASNGAEFGNANITMINVTEVKSGDQSHHRWWTSKWFLIGAAAGAAVAIGLAVTSGGGAQTVNLTPGFPTIGGSR